MGFSQGTRVVGGLLLEQMRLREAGVPGLGMDDGDEGIKFRFGVLCMGGGAPMLSELSYRRFSNIRSNYSTRDENEATDGDYSE
jgi:hypothetical protein